MERLAKEIKAKDQTLWEQIKSYIKGIISKLKALYKDLNAQSPEAEFIKGMQDKYEGGHEQYPIAHDVVDKFVEQYNKDKGTKYSDREYSYESLTSKEEMEVKTLPKLSIDEIKKYQKDTDLFGKDMRQIAASANNKKNTPTKTYL